MNPVSLGQDPAHAPRPHCGCSGARTAEMSRCNRGERLKNLLPGLGQKRSAKSFQNSPNFKCSAPAHSQIIKRFWNFNISASFGLTHGTTSPAPRTALDTRDIETAGQIGSLSSPGVQVASGHGPPSRWPQHCLQPRTPIHRMLVRPWET